MQLVRTTVFLSTSSKPSESLEIFTPKNFKEYVGQNKAKEISRIIIEAAKIENRSLPNILIDGSYGLGKTTLAKVIYHEANTTPKIIDALAANKELPEFFTKPLIVDEIHNLDPEVADSLNIVIDQGRARIIGCTTNPGALPSPFKSRFRTIHLENYTEKDIKQIIDLASLRKGVNFDYRILDEIAQRSRLNPRVATNHLSFLFDYMAVNRLAKLTVQEIRKAFSVLGVDTQGFMERDHRYMAALPIDRPVGLHYLSAVLGIDAKTIEREIEPYLLQTGKIDRMPRGRMKLRDI